MNCNVPVFYKMIFSNKFGFILETSLFLYYLEYLNKFCEYTPRVLLRIIKVSVV